MEERKLSCEIVKDLLPSYVDELLSEDVKEAVEEHLAECEDCKNALSDYERKQMEDIKISAEREEKFVKDAKKVKNLVIGIFTLIAIFYAFLLLFLFGGPIEKIDGADQYEKTMYKYTQEVVGKPHTGFYCFPVSIPKSAFSDGKEPTFYFSYKDTWDDPTCEVYLECEYSKEDYEKELTRLKGKVPSAADQPKMDEYLRYEESDRFINPVYMAIDRYNTSYEYAMDLGNNKIAYIFVSYIFVEEKLKKIPHEYLPNDFEGSIPVGFGEGFCVYITSRDGLSITLDYDR